MGIHFFVYMECFLACSPVISKFAEVLSFPQSKQFIQRLRRISFFHKGQKNFALR